MQAPIQVRSLSVSSLPTTERRVVIDETDSDEILKVLESNKVKVDRREDLATGICFGNHIVSKRVGKRSGDV